MPIQLTSVKTFIYNATFDRNNTLGEYALSSTGQPPNRSTNFPSSLIDLGDNTGTQGNPFVYLVNNAVNSIWTDDEFDNDADTHLLSVYVLNSGNFPTSNDWTKVVLPENVNQTGTEALQPTFTDKELYFTQNTNIAFSSYTGPATATAYIDNANWGIPNIILQKDTSISSLKVNNDDIGKIVAVGEPTIAIVDNQPILYFVYAYIREIDPITGYADLDFQAGFISKNN